MLVKVIKITIFHKNVIPLVLNLLNVKIYLKFWVNNGVENVVSMLKSSPCVNNNNIT